MTMHMDKSLEILGFPVSKFKALLASWSRTGKDPDDLSALADVSISSGSAAAMLGEAWRLGLIGFVLPETSLVPTRQVGLTEAGLAFIHATSRGRTVKEKAAKVLDQVLDRARDLLADTKSPVRIERIWVFGSYVKPEKADVGDIDIVIESSGKDFGDHRGMAAYIGEHYPGLLPAAFDPNDFRGAEEVFKGRKLFGVRLHPLLAPNTIDTLVRMHEPCALFFDASRGGRIEPEFHPHHPDSTGRKGMRDRLTMPDISAAERFEFTNPIVVDGLFSKRAKEASFEGMAHAVTENGDEFTLRWDARPGQGVMVRRSIHWGDDAWYCEFSVDAAPEADIPASRSWMLARQIALLAEADMLRLAAHRQQVGSMHEIEVDVTLDAAYASDHPLRDHLDIEIERAGHKISSKMKPALPSSMAFGVSLLLDGTGIGIARPCDFSEAEWEESCLPFSRAEYEEWAQEQGLDSRFIP